MSQILINSLAPIFVGLILGYFAGRRKFVDNKDVRSLIGFLMTFALPSSLFITIALTPRHLLLQQATSAISLALVYLFVYVITYSLSRLLDKDTSGNSAVMALTVAFPNAAAVGLPLLMGVYGAQSSVTVAIAIAIGSITITPITLAILESGKSTSGNLSQAAHIRASLWKALKKPVFWAPVLGVVFSAASLEITAWLHTSLSILGGATEGTALFVTGVIASGQAFRMDSRVVWATIGKNIIQPTLCLGIVLLLRMPHDVAKYVVLLSAVPSGFFGVLFGEDFDQVSQKASSSLVASTLFCVVTLAGWIWFLERMH